jgi:hypothetical protein
MLIAKAAWGQAQAENSDRWGFTVAPYLLLPNMDGRVTVRRIPSDVDVGPGDIFERLDFGAMLYLEMQQLAIGARGMWRAASWAEIGIGGRLNSIKGGLFAAPGQALPGIDDSQTKTWFDPLIAARLTAPLKSKWHLGISGDIGGFGITSDFAWQVLPFVGFRFTQLFELTLGYRALGMKYETGSGRNLFVYDMVIFGPQLGLVFRF